jgi:hypothetical protein
MAYKNDVFKYVTPKPILDELTQLISAYKAHFGVQPEANKLASLLACIVE